MDCSRLDAMIDAYLDGELGDAERSRIARHLAECERCAAHYGTLVAAVGRLETLPELRAPEEFVAGVMARLPERRPAAEPARVAWVLGLSGAVATAAIVAAALWIVWLVVSSWGQLVAAGGTLTGPLSAAWALLHGALQLGSALAGPVAWALLINLAALGAIALVYAWRGKLRTAAVYVVA